MVLCDTNILIEVYKGNPIIMGQLNKIGRFSLAVSDVTMAELFYGARNKHELQIIEKHLTHFTVIPIQENVSTLAVEWVRKYALSHKLNLPDALIAATAYKFQISLYTLNVKDFRFIDGLTLHTRADT